MVMRHSCEEAILLKVNEKLKLASAVMMDTPASSDAPGTDPALSASFLQQA